MLGRSAPTSRASIDPSPIPRESGVSLRTHFYTLYPTPYILHLTPYTLHPTPHTLHAARTSRVSIDPSPIPRGSLGKCSVSPATVTSDQIAFSCPTVTKDQIAFFKCPQNRTGAHQNPATCGARQGARNRRFDPASRAGGARET